MNGIVIIDKPAGWTSQDVTARLRRVFGTRRIGHGGTLDPMATGVLPVFVGRATRGVEFFEHAEKTYETELLLGVATDTEDTTGTVLFRRVRPLLPFFRTAFGSAGAAGAARGSSKFSKTPTLAFLCIAKTRLNSFGIMQRIRPSDGQDCPLHGGIYRILFNVVIWFCDLRI